MVGMIEVSKLREGMHIADPYGNIFERHTVVSLEPLEHGRVRSEWLELPDVR